MKENRKARNKKNKLEEIHKPRGYDRGLEIEKVCGSTDCTGTLQFLVKWHQCDELDLIPASEIAENDPNFLILFYEDRCPLNALARDRKQLFFEMDPPNPSDILPPVGGDSETEIAGVHSEPAADTESTIIELTAEQEQQLLTSEIGAAVPMDSSDIPVELEGPAFTYEVAPQTMEQDYASMPNINDGNEFSAVVHQNY